MDDVTIEGRMTAVEARAKSNTHQIEEIKKRQDNLDELVKSVAELANEQGHIKEDVTEIKTNVKALTNIPAKRWDGLVDKALYVVVGAFIMWLFAGAPGM